MNIPLFKVIKKGLYTSFQDLGRFGYQQFGVVTSGAMDSYSSQLANILVGNPRTEATLEITMIGPILRVEATSLVIAVCGADLSMKVNGRNAPLWKSFIVKKGDIIEFGKSVSGVRTYLAVSGGFQAKEVLGSKSYYGKANLGTAIENGDTLFGYKNETTYRFGLTPDVIPTFSKKITARVILGPQEQYFTDESIELFLNKPFQVQQGDRMGYRLKGTSPLVHKTTADIPSDAIPLGGIQVPSNGEPIVLLADRQTTGGYTRIANVITVDIYKIAQLPPGGTIHFISCTVEEAHRLYQKRAKFFQTLESFIK
ncbi:biotin-dependent carboxyltransferase family protein [Fredinandcohnia sp. 179-A 10B2 NHS]|uniref:5-oxoprolinase subunit C family protein n=1 Tax=Fredinandcohnia sp. 179-A 10B2 NHS TaxID=3235176 RepID=UPI00399EF6B3